MFTVIIPTLWRSPYLKSILDNLQTANSVKNIVLIDNAPNARTFEPSYSKLITLIQPENIYITASWNKGVAHSRTKFTCLLNDDIVYHSTAFNWLLENWPEDAGLIGLGANGINNYCEYSLQPTESRGYGFGAAMFFKTKEYVKIPEQLRLWYNDDFLFKFMPLNKYYFTAPVVGDMSKTLNNHEWNDIKQQDQEFWRLNYE